MGAGFVYILINASMPGVVKVGKTERDPEGRAKELSGVTGVPTPFVVVYHESFDDCSVAEAYVHTLLEAKGYRVASNREFFSAPAQVVIQTLIQAKTALRGKADGEQVAASNASMKSSDVPQSEPWKGILASAQAARYGIGDTLQDLAEAIRLYEQAAKLGSAEACYVLGTLLYKWGTSPGEDIDGAMKWLNEGARRGHAPCCARLASMYLFQGHLSNAGKCLAKYRDCDVQEDFEYEYWRAAYQYLSMAAVQKVAVPEVESFRPSREKILRSGEEHAKGGAPERLIEMCLVRYLLCAEQNLVRGTVSFWSGERGCGFITGEDGQEAFLSLADIVEGNPPPTVGQPVAFVPIPIDKGERLAYVVRLLAGKERGDITQSC